MKVPFDIKYKEQIQDGIYKVETANGEQIRIVCWDAGIELPIIGVTKDGEIRRKHIDGTNEANRDTDFYVIIPDNKEFTDTYMFNTICCHLELRSKIFEKDGNLEEEKRWQGMLGWLRSKKDLIIAEEHKDEKLTEFEEEVYKLLELSEPEGHGGPTIEKTKEYSKQLLELARKEITEEEIDMAYKTADEIQYRKGRISALKDMPAWKKTISVQKSSRPYLSIEGTTLYDGKGNWVDVNELIEKLPKETDKDTIETYF